MDFRPHLSDRRQCWRGRIAIGLLVVTALANGRLVRVAWTEANPVWDAEAALARFAPIVARLPSGTEVNYLDATPSAAGEDLLLARFALAPLRVVVGSPRAWILVDSRDPMPGFDADPANVRRVADYGDGVRLFRREGTH
jgi:hypothetical protein